MNQTTDRAVLFDLDGTLLDTAPDLAGAVNDLRLEAGCAALELSQLAPMCSFGARGMLQTGLGLYPDDDGYRETYDRYIERYRKRMTTDTRPFEGMRGVIREIGASGWRWGVVTNKFESLALPIMDAMAFEPAPACIVGGDSAGRPKPDPASILLACERAGLDRSRCIYIGDSARDMQAAAAAGMQRIGVGFGYIPPGDDIHAWDASRIVLTVSGMAGAIRELQHGIDTGTAATARDSEQA